MYLAQFIDGSGCKGPEERKLSLEWKSPEVVLGNTDRIAP